MMPELDGFEVCQRIRGNPAWGATRIVMLTAHGRDVERDKGLALGADAYVTKPFSTRDLVARVKQMLGSPLSLGPHVGTAAPVAPVRRSRPGLGGGPGGRRLARDQRARAGLAVLVGRRLRPGRGAGRGRGPRSTGAGSQPSRALAREIELLLHANAGRPIAAPPGHGLGALPRGSWRSPSAGDRRHAEAAPRAGERRAPASEQQRRLEAVLRDLADGLIACSADRRILLFNDAALRILDGHPELGLDRPLDRLIAPEPIVHAFELLREEQERPGRARERARGVRVRDRGRRQAAARPHGADPGPGRRGQRLRPRPRRCHRALGGREREGARVGELVQERARRPPAVRAAAEVLAVATPPAPERAAFLGVLERESATLCAQVERSPQVARRLAAGDWPSADLFSADLVRWTNRRLARGPAGADRRSAPACGCTATATT